jgi:hypothetical protein
MLSGMEGFHEFITLGKIVKNKFTDLSEQNISLLKKKKTQRWHTRMNTRTIYERVSKLLFLLKKRKNMALQ